MSRSHPPHCFIPLELNSLTSSSLGMASEGQNPPPPPWAEIIVEVRNKAEPSLLVTGLMLTKLKETTTNSVFMDPEAKNKVKRRFQHSLYVKFFRKSSLYDLIKSNLQSRLGEFSEVFVSNLPNGYLLIQCETHEAMQRILFEGPWTVNGFTLQTAPWHPYFEPGFTKLTTAAIWI